MPLERLALMNPVAPGRMEDSDPATANGAPIPAPILTSLTVGVMEIPNSHPGTDKLRYNGWIATAGMTLDVTGKSRNS